MGSLQDQLLKAGLATPEQLRKAREEQRREQRREPRGRRDVQEGSRTPGTRPAARNRPGTASPSAPGRASGSRKDDARPAGPRGEGRRRRAGAHPHRARPDQPRNKDARPPPADSPPERDASVQTLNLRIRALLDRYVLNDRNAEVTFHFLRGNVVRRMYVTDEQRRKLAGGELAIVGFRRRHHLVPTAVADEIQALRPIVFVHRAAAEAGEEPATPGSIPDAEDPYRDFPVPDDLHW